MCKQLMMVSGGLVHSKKNTWALFSEHMGVLGEAGRGRGKADGGQLVPCALEAVALRGHQCGPHQVRANQSVTSIEK